MESEPDHHSTGKRTSSGSSTGESTGRRARHERPAEEDDGRLLTCNSSFLLHYNEAILGAHAAEMKAKADAADLQAQRVAADKEREASEVKAAHEAKLKAQKKKEEFKGMEYRLMELRVEMKHEQSTLAKAHKDVEELRVSVIFLLFLLK